MAVYAMAGKALHPVTVAPTFPTSFMSVPITGWPDAAPCLRLSVMQALQYDPKQEASLDIGCYAEVTGAWTTSQPEALPSLRSLHVCTDSFLDARLKWRSKQALTILELRVFKLQEPLVIPMAEDYFGCFSWGE